MVERGDVRKQMAPISGAEHVIDPRTSDAGRELLELTKGLGADVWFECAGIEAILKAAFSRPESAGPA